VVTNITLGPGQVNAVNQIISFIHSFETAFSLSGYAGTGKTTVVKEIVRYAKSKHLEIVLCAPTHIAKLVLEQATEQPAITLHKLLALTPNVEILDLDFKNLLFQIKGKQTLFPSNGLIICDESSMISDDLFDLLIDRCELTQSKVLFVGDKAQLQPVNALNHSKVFNLENSVILDYIYRQPEESGLISVLPTLRSKPINIFMDSVGLDGSLLCYSNIQNFFKELVPAFKKAINNRNILETKMLTYTNKRTEGFNTKLKEVLFGTEQEYYQSEFLTCYENLEFDGLNFFNSMTYIVADKPEKTDILISGFIKLPGWKLNLYDSVTKHCSLVSIISRTVEKDYIDSLAQFLETLRINAIQTKYSDRRASSQLWKQYYQALNSFTLPTDLYYENRLVRRKSFDYGYASTVHKSQGQTIQNVFIDMKDINLCKNPDELRQLQYVSISRSKQNVYIYC
jgi:exodeoxyribonuclease-5